MHDVRRRKLLASVPAAALGGLAVSRFLGAREATIEASAQALASSPAASEGAPREATPGERRASDEAPSLLEALRTGTRVGPWQVSRVELFAGAVAVELAGALGKVRLEVVARDDHPTAAMPVASSRTTAVFVCNGGSGKTPTDEDQGLAALTLAAHLERHEERGFREALDTHDARVRRPEVMRAV